MGANLSSVHRTINFQTEGQCCLQRESTLSHCSWIEATEALLGTWMMAYGDAPPPRLPPTPPRRLFKGPPPSSKHHTPISPAAVTLQAFSSLFPLIKCPESIHHTLKTHKHKKTEPLSKGYPRRQNYRRLPEICLYWISFFYTFFS